MGGLAGPVGFDAADGLGGGPPDGAPGCGYQGRMTAAAGAVGTDLDFCVGSCSRTLARAR